MDLLDDCVMAVGLVGGDGVEHVGVGGGCRAWNRQVSNRVSWPTALFFSALKSGIRRTTSRPGIWSVFFWAANAVKPISATSARETHRPVTSSKTASVYSTVVPASSLMVVIAALARLSIRMVTDTAAPPASAA